MKPKHQRLVFISASMVCLCVSVVITLRAFRDNLVYFYSPTELQTQTLTAGRVVRVGGLVESGSITRTENDSMMFDISDGNAKVRVRFAGITPNLFREGQGVVAEGTLENDGVFKAKSILAKHDEQYMPREVVDTLKRSGRWKGDASQ